MYNLTTKKRNSTGNWAVKCLHKAAFRLNLNKTIFKSCIRKIFEYYFELEHRFFHNKPTAILTIPDFYSIPISLKNYILLKL